MRNHYPSLPLFQQQKGYGFFLNFFKGCAYFFAKRRDRWSEKIRIPSHWLRFWKQFCSFFLKGIQKNTKSFFARKKDFQRDTFFIILCIFKRVRITCIPRTPRLPRIFRVPRIPCIPPFAKKYISHLNSHLNSTIKKK